MVSLIPENVHQYARFVVGNAITNTLGIPFAAGDMNVAMLADEKLDVLRTAVENARADNRSYVTYEDYPDMKDGNRPENFYRGQRLQQSDIDLYVKSASDPVFEMFTLVGGFNFKDTPDGGFSIKDAYNFDASKSPRNREATDAYSARVFAAQDVDQSFTFNIAGIVPPKDSEASASQYAYDNGFLKSAYNTIENKFAQTGKLTVDDLPLEFIALAREKIANFFAANPEAQTAGFVDMEMPDFEDMPDIMTFFEAEPTEDGGFQIFDKLKTTMGNMAETSGNLLDIDIKLPAFDRLVGNIPDINIGMPTFNSSLPVSILSDDRVEQMKSAIGKRLYSDNVDDMAFGEAFAKSRADGLDVFKWRGNSYTTQLAEEVDGN